jgi:2-hydroxy-6-oxonona-2,4-dienedioate hydrolase
VLNVPFSPSERANSPAKPTRELLLFERALEVSASVVSLLGLGLAHLLGAGGILPVITKSPVPIEASSLIKSAWTEVPGGPIHYRVGGARAEELPIVLLIHGLVVASTYMVPTAEQLAPFCRVYVPDLPGYGKSYKPDKILGLSELADALAEWMDALALQKAHFVGNSFGCQIIAEFAVRHSQRIDHLVLQGPTVDPTARSLRSQFFRLLINSPREQHSMGRIMLEDYRAAGLRRIRDTIKLALQDRIEDKLPLIKAPTLVVRGEKDPVVPQSWAEKVTVLLPHGKLQIIPNAGHTINYSMPAQFAAVILPFLGLQ